MLPTRFQPVIKRVNTNLCCLIGTFVWGWGWGGRGGAGGGGEGAGGGGEGEGDTLDL